MVVVLALGLALPQTWTNPVANMHSGSYNHESFWYYPWGKSVTHKGVDVFAATGTEVRSSTHGLVIACSENPIGGKYVLVLGPKWRLHYYAHLHTVETGWFSLVGSGSRIGTVGATGNAAGKPPHLHYSIMTLVPYPWRIDSSIQGWRKILYLNPMDFFVFS